MSCSVRTLAAAAGLAGVLALAGCGFRLAGSAAVLPHAMKATYIASSQPYGGLENLLRRAIQAEGYRVVDDPRQATATLDIVRAAHELRVLAVNSRGQPLEYAVTYTVQYRLEDGSGHQLLAPTTIRLTRELAYNVNIELGASRRQEQLLESMQRDASRLILLRLQALGKAPAHPAPGTAGAPAHAPGFGARSVKRLI